ncbi:AT-hook motif nuclear-localized protein 10 isoform X2 [Hevea brasiliensis]|uniref:AT-hook motif nuclear-localized protein 10 isoform X2 n=1 Tax=Hevea brasiliensis TaxID=3981 RepID=UPI0025CCF3C0|nr:AT-hook motif nuclear-localized protein 10 isoform X2 [Hevea brasiliensis]
MEEKESTPSGSPGYSGTDSPPPVSSVVAPQLMNINMNMAAENMVMERTIIASATTTPPTTGSDGGSGVPVSGSVDLFRKKKRGRPRKYDSDGNLRVQPFHHQAVPGVTLSPPGFSFSPPSPPSDGLIYSSSKRGRGRPPGSGNWQLLASLELFANTAGGDFTPHVVTVNTGEDVAGKILSFAQKGPRGICILSANGAVSNVTIRQPGSSGGILTYEGRFEILSLSGSFTVTETGGVRSRTGGLSVSLASPDGRVIGGGIAGLLLAASPIQIVVGSFMPNGYKAHKRKHHRENASSSVIPGAQDVLTEARPISQAKPDGETCSAKTDGETCLISTSPLPEQSHGGTDNNVSKQQIPNATISFTPFWNGSQPTSIQRPSPDINLSVPIEEDAQGMVL